MFNFNKGDSSPALAGLLPASRGVCVLEWARRSSEIWWKDNYRVIKPALVAILLRVSLDGSKAGNNPMLLWAFKPLLFLFIINFPRLLTKVGILARKKKKKNVWEKLLVKKSFSYADTPLCIPLNPNSVFRVFVSCSECGEAGLPYPKCNMMWIWSGQLPQQAGSGHTPGLSVSDTGCSRTDWGDNWTFVCEAGFATPYF